MANKKNDAQEKLTAAAAADAARIKEDGGVWKVTLEDQAEYEAKSTKKSTKTDVSTNDAQKKLDAVIKGSTSNKKIPIANNKLRDLGITQSELQKEYVAAIAEDPIFGKGGRATEARERDIAATAEELRQEYAKKNREQTEREIKQAREEEARNALLAEKQLAEKSRENVTKAHSSALDKARNSSLTKSSSAQDFVNARSEAMGKIAKGSGETDADLKLMAQINKAKREYQWEEAGRRYDALSDEEKQEKYRRRNSSALDRARMAKEEGNLGGKTAAEARTDIGENIKDRYYALEQELSDPTKGGEYAFINRVRSAAGETAENIGNWLYDTFGYKPGKEVYEKGEARKIGEIAGQQFANEMATNPTKSYQTAVKVSDSLANMLSYKIATGPISIFAGAVASETELAKGLAKGLGAEKAAEIAAEKGMHTANSIFTSSMALGTFGDTYNQSRAEGQGKLESTIRATAAGAISYVTESLGGIGGTKSPLNKLETAAKQNWITAIVYNAFEEGGEEFAEYTLNYLAQGVIDLAAQGKWNQVYDFAQVIDNFETGFWSGGIFGVGQQALSGGSRVVNRLGNNSYSGNAEVDAKLDTAKNELLDNLLTAYQASQDPTVKAMVEAQLDAVLSDENIPSRLGRSGVNEMNFGDVLNKAPTSSAENVSSEAGNVQTEAQTQQEAPVQAERQTEQKAPEKKLSKKEAKQEEMLDQLDVAATERKARQAAQTKQEAAQQAQSTAEVNNAPKEETSKKAAQSGAQRKADSKTLKRAYEAYGNTDMKKAKFDKMYNEAYNAASFEDFMANHPKIGEKLKGVMQKAFENGQRAKDKHNAQAYLDNGMIMQEGDETLLNNRKDVDSLIARYKEEADGGMYWDKADDGGAVQLRLEESEIAARREAIKKLEAYRDENFAQKTEQKAEKKAPKQEKSEKKPDNANKKPASAEKKLEKTIKNLETYKKGLENGNMAKMERQNPDRYGEIMYNLERMTADEHGSDYFYDADEVSVLIDKYKEKLEQLRAQNGAQTENVRAQVEIARAQNENSGAQAEVLRAQTENDGAQNKNVGAQKSKVDSGQNFGYNKVSQYATVAPYYNTKVTAENKQQIKEAVNKVFTDNAKSAAKLLGMKLKGETSNIGGFTFSEGEAAGQQVHEISYSFEFEDATPEQAQLFASLMAENGYEQQEAAIQKRYVDNIDNGNAYEYTIRYRNIDEFAVAKALEEAGITDYTIDTTNGIIQILEFDTEKNTEVLHLVDALLADGKENFYDVNNKPIQSEYLDEKTRAGIYRSWLESELRDGERRSYISEALRKVEKRIAENERVKAKNETKADAESSGFFDAQNSAAKVQQESKTAENKISLNVEKSMDMDTYTYDNIAIMLDGKEVGTIGMVVDEGEPYLERIDIDEEYRNQGIGTDALRLVAEKYGEFLIAPDNEDAKRLYERYGDESNSDNAPYLDQGYGVYSIYSVPESKGYMARTKADAQAENSDLTKKEKYSLSEQEVAEIKKGVSVITDADNNTTKAVNPSNEYSAEYQNGAAHPETVGAMESDRRSITRAINENGALPQKKKPFSDFDRYKADNDIPSGERAVLARKINDPLLGEITVAQNIVNLAKDGAKFIEQDGKYYAQNEDGSSVRVAQSAYNFGKWLNDNGVHYTLNQNAEVPKKINGRYVSKSVTTFIASRGGTDAMVKAIAAKIERGETGYVYDKKSHKEVIRSAQDTIIDRGFDGAVEYFNEMALGDHKYTSELNTLGIMLKNIASEAYMDSKGKNKDALDLATEIQAWIAANQTNAGQVTESMKIDRQLINDNSELYYQSLVESLQEKYKKRLKGKEITLDAELLRKVAETAGTKEGTKWADRLNVSIANQIPATVLEKVNAYRYFCMLSSGRTHAKNVISNTVQFTMVLQKNLWLSLFERMYKAKHSDYMLTTSGLKTSADAVKFGYEVTGKTDMGGGKYSNKENFVQAYRTNTMRGNGELSKLNIPGRILDRLANTTTGLLSAEDAVAKKMLFVNRFVQIMEANHWTAEFLSDKTNPDAIKAYEKAASIAMEEALKGTFNDQSAMVQLLTQWKNLDTTDSAKAAAKVATATFIETMFPFKNVPFNIAGSAVRYSPVGLLFGICDLKKVKNGSLDARVALENIAKGMTGTTVSIGGALLAMMGMLTLGRDSDEDKPIEEKEDTTMYLKIPNENGDIYIEIDWVDSIAMQLRTGLEIKDVFDQMVKGKSGEEEEAIADFWGTMIGLATRSVDSFMDIGMMSSFSNLLLNKSGARTIEDIVTNQVTNLATQFIPRIVTDIRQAFDSEKRNTYYKDKTGKDSEYPKWIQWVSSVVPQSARNQYIAAFGNREKLPARLDEWGNSLGEENVFKRAAEALIIPGKTYRANDDKVQEMLDQLDAKVDKNVFPPDYPKFITVNGNKVNLSGKEYEEVARQIGQERYKLLDELRKDKKFQKLSADEKAELIQNCYTIASEMAKYGFDDDYSISKITQDVQDAKKEKVSIPNYLRAKQAFSNMSEYEKGGVKYSRAYQLADYLMKDTSTTVQEDIKLIELITRQKDGNSYKSPFENIRKVPNTSQKEQLALYVALNDAAEKEADLESYMLEYGYDVEAALARYNVAAGAKATYGSLGTTQKPKADKLLAAANEGKTVNRWDEDKITLAASAVTSVGKYGTKKSENTYIKMLTAVGFTESEAKEFYKYYA